MIFLRWTVIFNVLTVVYGCVMIAREGYQTTLVDVILVGAMLAVYGFHCWKQMKHPH